MVEQKGQDCLGVVTEIELGNVDYPSGPPIGELAKVLSISNDFLVLEHVQGGVAVSVYLQDVSQMAELMFCLTIHFQGCDRLIKCRQRIVRVYKTEPQSIDIFHLGHSHLLVCHQCPLVVLFRIQIHALEFPNPKDTAQLLEHLLEYTFLSVPSIDIHRLYPGLIRVLDRSEDAPDNHLVEAGDNVESLIRVLKKVSYPLVDNLRTEIQIFSLLSHYDLELHNGRNVIFSGGDDCQSLFHNIKLNYYK